MSLETVKTHVGNVLTKLGAQHRTHAVVIAHPPEHGGQPEPVRTCPQQHRPRVPDQPFPVGSHRQPPVC